MLELASIYNTKIQRLTRSDVYRHMQIKHVKSHLINNLVSLYIFDREIKKTPGICKYPDSLPCTTTLQYNVYELHLIQQS